MDVFVLLLKLLGLTVIKVGTIFLIAIVIRAIVYESDYE
jgi:hypothetical protein